LGAKTGSFPIAAVFGGEHAGPQERVEVACGPTVVAALFQQQHLFGWQCRFLVCLLDDVGPVRVQLITAVLRDEDIVADGIDPKALSIAYAGCVTLRGREGLVRLLRVIAPDTAARLEFCARIYPR